MPLGRFRLPSSGVLRGIALRVDPPARQHLDERRVSPRGGRHPARRATRRVRASAGACLDRPRDGCRFRVLSRVGDLRRKALRLRRHVSGRLLHARRQRSALARARPAGDPAPLLGKRRRSAAPHAGPRRARLSGSTSSRASPAADCSRGLSMFGSGESGLGSGTAGWAATGSSSSSRLDSGGWTRATACNPGNHWISGHGIWHLLNALALFLVYLFYRQFDVLRFREVPLPSPTRPVYER